MRLILIIVLAILPLIPLYLMKLLLDVFTLETPPDINYIFYILAGFGLAQVILTIASNINTYISQIQSDIVSDQMSSLVVAKAVNLDLEYFDADQYHDIFERALAQSGNRPIMVLNTLTQLLRSSISLAAIFILLATLHWAVSIVLIIIAIPIALIRLFYANKLVRLKVKQTQKHRLSRYFFKILTHSNDAKEIRVFGYGQYLKSKFLKLLEALRSEKKSIYFKQNTSIALAQSVEVIAIVIAITFIAMRAVRGLISVGDIAMYFGAFQKGQTSLNSALSSVVTLHENRKYMEHIFQFLDLEEKIKSPSEAPQVPHTIDKISIDELAFSYPNTTKEVLSDISFTAKKGEITAIVGENGSGKTSLVKLIARLYDPTKGGISINDMDISQFEYNISVLENIQLSDIHKDLDQSQVESASKLGLASEFIDALPQKYNTPLGRSFTDGQELSGGQWQKIALSRAFYKDADIIILDEPTSFIDPLAEDEIFNNLRTLAKDKILILITHRIYNLRQADQIIVLENGRISEKGHHAQLMESGGIYKEMFEKQA